LPSAVFADQFHRVDFVPARHVYRIEINLHALAQRQIGHGNLGRSHPDADHVLAGLLLDADSHNDDVTLLLAQLPAAPLATLTTHFPAVPASVPEGRAFLHKALTSWNCADSAADALLLLSETLTNAVQHASGPVGLHLHRTETDLTVEVSDGSAQLPQPRSAIEDEESGRGLILVRALAASWGVRPTDEGKTTWFTLRL